MKSPEVWPTRRPYDAGVQRSQGVVFCSCKNAILIVHLCPIVMAKTSPSLLDKRQWRKEALAVGEGISITLSLSVTMRE